MCSEGKFSTFICSLSLLAMTIITSSCASWGAWGSMTGPQKTEQLARMKDIAGVYSYPAFNNKEVIVELNASGVFTITGSNQRSGIGNWSLGKDNVIELIYNVKPPVSYSGWFITESDDPKYAFAIVGGDGDGDWWRKMKRIR